MDEVILRVEVEVNPTETVERVKLAMRKIFGEIPIRTKPLGKATLLVGEAEGSDVLISFHDLLRREHIRSAARTVLLDGIDKKTISFCLNKQVAYVGHISFSKEVSESPLGPIRVKIACEDPRKLIEWLAPRTA
jgi:predicted RNA binding protein with dsRBD fold (UPF0201 family)